MMTSTSTSSPVIMTWPTLHLLLLPTIAILLLTPGIHVPVQADAPPKTNSSQKPRQFPSGFGGGPGGNPGQLPNQQALLQLAQNQFQQQLPSTLPPLTLTVDCERINTNTYCKLDCSPLTISSAVKYCEDTQSECCGLPAWAIALIVIAVLLIVAGIVGAIIFFLVIKPKRDQNQVGATGAGGQQEMQAYQTESQSQPYGYGNQVAPEYYGGGGAATSPVVEASEPDEKPKPKKNKSKASHAGVRRSRH